MNFRTLQAFFDVGIIETYVCIIYKGTDFPELYK